MHAKSVFKFLMMLTISASLSVWFTACNKKCANLNGGTGDGVLREYEFGDCKVYARIDSHLVISSQSEFDKFKNEKLQVCDNKSLPAVDFSKEALLGFKISEIACNIGFKKTIQIDTQAKTYNYVVILDRCTGCNTEITSHNWVVGPAVPSGYKVNFVKK